MMKLKVKNPNNLPLPELKQVLSKLMPAKSYCLSLDSAEGSILMTVGYLPWRVPPYIRKYTEAEIKEAFGIYG